jgi:hypothetical protein
MMTDAVPDVRVQYVRVTNNTPQMWADSYDGIPVTIMPGQAQNLQLPMAAHFFGWHPDVTPEEMMRHIVRRRALADPKYTIHGNARHDRELAAEMFKDFQIEPVTFKLVEDRGLAGKRSAYEPVPALAADDEDDTVHEPTAVKHEDPEPRPTPYGTGRRPQRR